MTHVNDLGQLMTELHNYQSILPRHTQHLHIRLIRLVSQLEIATASTNSVPNQHNHDHARDQLETLIRIKGRVQELEQSLTDQVHGPQTQDSVRSRLLSLSQLTNRVVTQLTINLQSIVQIANSSSDVGDDQDEQLSRKKKKRVITTSATPQPVPLQRSTSSTSAINSYLASTSISKFPQHQAQDDFVTRASKKVLDARALQTLAMYPSNVLPSGTTIGSLFRQQLTRGLITDTEANPSSSPTRTVSLDHLVSQLLSNSSSQRCIAWSNLRSQLYTATASLVPIKLDSGRAKLDLEATLCREEPFDQVLSSRVIESLATVVRLLGRLCAPSRDSQVAALEARLTRLRSEAPPDDSSSSNEVQQLIDISNGILELSRDMKRDLATFRANAAGDRTVTTDYDWLELVRSEAIEREREAVLDLVSAAEQRGRGRQGEQAVREATATWLARAQPSTRTTTEVEAPAPQAARPAISFDHIALALVRALFQQNPVSTRLLDDEFPHQSRDTDNPHSPSDAPLGLACLPPIFAISIPRLVALQNMLQGIVILSCLTILLQPPAGERSVLIQEEKEKEKFEKQKLLDRLWTILGAVASENESGEDSTRLDHIADEVIEATRRIRSSQAQNSAQEGGRGKRLGLGQGQGQGQGQEWEQEVQRLKEGVRRILRYEDPVYRLLKDRLQDALSRNLVDRIGYQDQVGQGAGWNGRMRTGFGQKTDLVRNEDKRTLSTIKLVIPTLEPIKGFEKLMDKVQAAAQGISDVLEWSWTSWGTDDRTGSRLK